MGYLCQKLPYLKEITTKIISCTLSNVKDEKLCDNSYIIELEESIFFPEGGGQPADYGKIGDANIVWVSRESGKILHRVDKPLEVGSKVDCILDWKRRYDHMQQHSGQHLLSAILDCYNITTLSWELGSTTCNVDINANKSVLTDEFIEKVENEINSKIRQSLPVTVHEYNTNQINDLVEKGRITSKLPKYDAGLVTFIEIKDTDFNMCCGTHVSSLAELQAIKLLHTEPMRGNIRLHFLCGQRVLDKLSKCYYNERQLNKILMCQSIDHVTRAESIKKEIKSLEKTKVNLMKELAIVEANNIINCNSKFQFIHKEDYDNTYLSTLMKILNDKLSNQKEKVVLAVCGGGGASKGAGLFSLKASDDFFIKHESMILSKLGAKGKSRNGNLQGKTESLKGLGSLVADLEKLVI